MGRFQAPTEESMTSSHFRTVWHAAMALTVIGPMTGCSVAVGGEAIGSQEESLCGGCAPSVPPVLAVPDGNQLAFHLDALGVQIYGCRSLPTGFAWVFSAPEAQLFNRGGHVVGK